MEKHFFYKNHLGRQKELRVYGTETPKEKYFNVIWDCATGEKCSEGENSMAEIQNFLSNYSIIEKEI